MQANCHCNKHPLPHTARKFMRIAFFYTRFQSDRMEHCDKVLFQHRSIGYFFTQNFGNLLPDCQRRIEPLILILKDQPDFLKAEILPFGFSGTLYFSAVVDDLAGYLSSTTGVSKPSTYDSKTQRRREKTGLKYVPAAYLSEIVPFADF